MKEKTDACCFSLSLLSLNLARLLPPPRPPRNPSPSLHPSPLQVPSTPLKVTLTNGNVVITPPVKNFTAIDPTTNATAYPVPTWARLTAKEKTASTQGQALLNATGYPFVYGYVPTSGLKNTTNYTLAAVSAVGTAVNATATALNFTSPVAGLGSDLAQAINNAIKVCLGFVFFGLVSAVVFRQVGEKEREGRRKRKRKRRNHSPLSTSPTNIKMQRKQTTNAAYNLTVGKAINATVYKVQKKRETEKKGRRRERGVLLFLSKKTHLFLLPFKNNFNLKILL
jgi:hypothetical protein